MVYRIYWLIEWLPKHSLSPAAERWRPSNAVA